MYLALPVSSGKFLRATRVSKYSRTETKKILYFRSRDYYPLGSRFPTHWTNIIFFNFSHNKLWRFCLITPAYDPCLRGSTAGKATLRWLRPAVVLCLNKERRRVWAVPFSLAATYGITIVLFSSGYWNVLLPRVSSLDKLQSTDM